MPNIRPYTSQIDAESALPNATAQASDFGGTGLVAVGEALDRSGAQVGDAQTAIYRNKARGETTTIDMKLATAAMALKEEMRQRAQSWTPGTAGPTIHEVMQSRVKETLDGLNVDANGDSVFQTAYAQRHFDQLSANLASHMLVESGALQAKLDGQHAVENHHAFLNQASAAVSKNPLEFDAVSQNLSAMVHNPQGIYAALTQPHRDELVREGEAVLANATVQGTIRTAPKLALEALQKGWMSTYLPADKITALMGHAEQGVHALSVDVDRAHKDELWKRQEETRASEATLFSKMALFDSGAPGAQPLTARDVLDSKLMQADPVKAGALLGVLHTRSRERLEPQGTDPSVRRDLFNRIHLPVDDPRKITDEMPLNQAYAQKGKLSYTDLTNLRKELADARTPEGATLGQAKARFLKSVTSSITQSNVLLGKLDKSGDVNFGLYANMVDRSVEQAKKDGKDPHALFDPASPYYLGKPEKLRPYQKTLQESSASIAQGYTPKAVAPERLRKPGESTSDFLERVDKRRQPQAVGQ